MLGPKKNIFYVLFIRRVVITILRHVFRVNAQKLYEKVHKYLFTVFLSMHSLRRIARKLSGYVFISNHLQNNYIIINIIICIRSIHIKSNILSLFFLKIAVNDIITIDLTSMFTITLTLPFLG